MLLCRLLLALEVNGMKNSLRIFALRFAATAVLFAPTVVAHAQSTSQSVCQKVWDGGTTKYICNNVYIPPPPTPVKPTIENETVKYDAAAEARKAELRANDHRTPAG